MEEQAKIWLQARDIIAKALWEWRVTFKGSRPSEDDREFAAAAILARLAANDPPILICYPDELKDE